MVSRGQILKEMSAFIGIEPPLTVDGMNCQRSEIETLYRQLKVYDGSVLDRDEPRPPLQQNNRGFRGWDYYPEKMSNYIRRRFGIEIPDTSSISARTYNKFADWLGAREKHQ